MVINFVGMSLHMCAIKWECYKGIGKFNLVTLARCSCSKRGEETIWLQLTTFPSLPEYGSV